MTPAVVNGSSMESTLFDGELVLVNKMNLDEIERFDIVIVNVEGSLLIKRVMALPNETIEYKEGKLFINDEEVRDPISDVLTLDFKGETKDDEYYLLGDNRGISKDSRVYGAFSKEDIKGSVNFIIYPFSKFGSIEK